MDFRFTDDQQSIQHLARGLLEKEATVERLKAIEAGTEWFDRRLWSTLADAGLLGTAVPEAFGGMGFGIAELCMLLVEIGRAVAPVPALPALVLAGLTVAEFGTDAQRRRWLPPLAAGDAILTAALVDTGSASATRPATRAQKDGTAWVLHGTKQHVPAVDLAARVIVPAATADGVALFLVDPRAGGVRLSRHQTSTGEPLFTVECAGVRVDGEDVLGGDTRAGGEKAEWIAERARVATCALQVGVSERALEMTSRYVCERIQFGVPIGSFQAVQHRLADGYVDLEAMRWVMWRAAWRLATGQPAAREAAVAKFWAADGGARIANTAQHLHGGIGVDVDYPVHRYFLWTKALELSDGAATPQLVRLGRDLARTGPAETPSYLPHKGGGSRCEE
jgi:alkylation response protein AidB-like acyl-CoA dehydrogenase